MGKKHPQKIRLQIPEKLYSMSKNKNPNLESTKIPEKLMWMTDNEDHLYDKTGAKSKIKDERGN